jgi:hypothetical protein
MDTRERLLVDDLLMRKVDEVSYLVTTNAALYRPIVRFFHQRYESGETGWLWPGEVAAFVRQNHPHHPRMPLAPVIWYCERSRSTCARE